MVWEVAVYGPPPGLPPLSQGEEKSPPLRKRGRVGWGPVACPRSRQRSPASTLSNVIGKSRTRTPVA